MSISSKFVYSEDEAAQVLQLPYKDDSFNMFFVLPKNRHISPLLYSSSRESGVAQLLRELTSERLSGYFSNNLKAQVIVSLFL